MGDTGLKKAFCMMLQVDTPGTSCLELKWACKCALRNGCAGQSLGQSPGFHPGVSLACHLWWLLQGGRLVALFPGAALDTRALKVLVK